MAGYSRPFEIKSHLHLQHHHNIAFLLAILNLLPCLNQLFYQICNFFPVVIGYFIWLFIANNIRFPMFGKYIGFDFSTLSFKTKFLALASPMVGIELCFKLSFVISPFSMTLVSLVDFIPFWDNYNSIKIQLGCLCKLSFFICFLIT